MSIKGRVQRLQARLAGACPECHGKPQAIDAYYPDEGEPAPEPECCSGCGRQLQTVIRVVYDEEGEGVTPID
jgi:hypothetical protein